MQMSHDEYLELKQQLISDLNSEYKRIDDCDITVKAEQTKLEELRRQFGDMRVEQAKTNTRLGVLIGILGAIAVPVLALSVKLLFGS